ncbi:MAG: AMP-dependent synthetase [Dehalococcoidia bacterium]|nr:AMP-dependent synthetase [Dehalococcoidia bacterium]MQG16600.1 AMP-binding protein [SAR202 cluster bacterium]|tara:strand:- start:6227 stop:7711 length:1485 start_codon:yes stop_codon:yes gene_type:complete
MLTSILQNKPHDAVAIKLTDGEFYSYKQLLDLVDDMASKLSSNGVKPGKVVNIVIDNSIEFLVSFLSVTRCGAIAAPLNPSYTVSEFMFYIEDANSDYLIVKDNTSVSISAAKDINLHVITVGISKSGLNLTDFKGELTGNHDPDPVPDDAVALFLHTSGTTSQPKGVPLTHGNLLASLGNIIDTYNLGESDTSILVMPLFHVHGLIGVALSTLASGGCLVLSQRFSASTFWNIQSNTSATWYSAVPTIHKILLDRADLDSAPYQSFRFIRSCSSPLSSQLLLAVENRFGSPVLEAYGMTEAAHQMSSNLLPPAKSNPGSVGMPTGVDISVRDETGIALSHSKLGEVCVKGPNVMGGYFNNVSANKSAFWGEWFRTGDQGFLNEDQVLTLTGRLKELINRGGEKISPVEVDQVIASHSAVLEAISFSLPDEKYGESVNAAVVLSEPASESSIIEFCLNKLAHFKVPDRIFVLDELPKSATGKIKRRNIAEMFMD